jgi:hypothetical protein
MASFKLGTDAGDHLIVEINGRPDERDDWVSATISVHVGAFSATIDATLMTSDFPRFRRQLEPLYRTLSGSANFDTIECQLEITCVGNERGGIAVNGTVQDRVGDGNELRFRFDIDQTYLPRIITELQDIESEFPNKIHPAFPQ